MTTRKIVEPKVEKLSARRISAEVRKTLFSAGLKVGTTSKPSDYIVTASKISGDDSKFSLIIQWNFGVTSALIKQELQNCEFYQAHKDSIELKCIRTISDYESEELAAAVSKHLHNKGLAYQDFRINSWVNNKLSIETDDTHIEQLRNFLTDCQVYLANTEQFNVTVMASARQEHAQPEATPEPQSEVNIVADSTIETEGLKLTTSARGLKLTTSARGLTQSIISALRLAGYSAGTTKQSSDYKVSASKSKNNQNNLVLTIKWTDGDSVAIIEDTLEYSQIFNENKCLIDVKFDRQLSRGKSTTENLEANASVESTPIRSHDSLQPSEANSALYQYFLSDDGGFVDYLTCKQIDLDSIATSTNESNQLVIESMVFGKDTLANLLVDCPQYQVNKEEIVLYSAINSSTEIGPETISETTSSEPKTMDNQSNFIQDLTEYLANTYDDSVNFEVSKSNTPGYSYKIEWFDVVSIYDLNSAITQFYSEFRKYNGTNLLLEKYCSEYFLTKLREWGSKYYWWSACTFGLDNQPWTQSIKYFPNSTELDECDLDFPVKLDKNKLPLEQLQKVFYDGGLEENLESLLLSVVDVLHFIDLDFICRNELKDSTVDDCLDTILKHYPNEIINIFWKSRNIMHIKESHTEEPTITTANTETKDDDAEFSRLINATTAEIKRVGGSVDYWRNHLINVYNKRSRQFLSVEQLKDFLNYLVAQDPSETTKENTESNNDERDIEWARNAWGQELRSLSSTSRKVMSHYFLQDADAGLSDLVDCMVKLEQEYNRTGVKKNEQPSTVTTTASTTSTDSKQQLEEEFSKELAEENGAAAGSNNSTAIVTKEKERVAPSVDNSKSNGSVSTKSFKFSNPVFVTLEYQTTEGKDDLICMSIADNLDLLRVFSHYTELISQTIYSDFKYVSQEHIDMIAVDLNCDITDDDADHYIAYILAASYVMKLIDDALGDKTKEIDFSSLEGYCPPDVLSRYLYD